MNRPDNILVYDEMDLKLGIKSSLPQTRPADTLQEAARTTARSASCRRKRGL